MLATLAIGAALLGGQADAGAIVFARERNDRHTLQRLDPDGTLTELAKAKGGIYDVTASPDGSRLAYVVEGRRGHSVRVWSRTGDRQIHRVPGRQVEGIDWSPDGRRIVFAEGKELEPETLELWTMSPRGNAVRRVTRNNAPEGQPSFAPNSRRVVYVRDRGNTYNLASIAVTGGRSKAIARTQAYETEPEVGPDGRIAYVSRPSDGSVVLRVMDADGGDRRTIAALGPHARVAPSWSPDGRTVVFARAWQLHIADMESGDVVRRLRSTTDDRYPVFVP